jgi:RecA/RadA recombinase
MVTPMSMQNDVVEASNIGNLGKLMTKFMRLVTDKLRDSGTTLLLINHEKEKI